MWGLPRTYVCNNWRFTSKPLGDKETPPKLTLPPTTPPLPPTPQTHPGHLRWSHGTPHTTPNPPTTAFPAQGHHSLHESFRALRQTPRAIHRYLAAIASCALDHRRGHRPRGRFHRSNYRSRKLRQPRKSVHLLREARRRRPSRCGRSPRFSIPLSSRHREDQRHAVRAGHRN